MGMHSGKIITFFSYKGGAGRTMALANVAWILASNGKRVLTIDWDLEAPGLHRYYHPFLDDKDMVRTDGIMDFLLNYVTEAMTPLTPGAHLAHDWYVPHTNITRYATSLRWQFPSNGSLDFVPAGRMGTSYLAQVTNFRWDIFYDRLGGGAFLEAVKARMRSEYDYVLIDSRTGVSDTAGVCTVQLPDLLVVGFTLDKRCIEGAAAVASAVVNQRDPTSIRVFPVPMRVEISERDRMERMRDVARSHFDPFLTHLVATERQRYWGQVGFPYVPFFAYEVALAAFCDQGRSLLASAERLTAFLSEGQVTGLVSPPEDVRREIFAQYVSP